MAGTQPMLDDCTQTELLTQLSEGVIAQTLGPVMFDRYVNDIAEIHGGGALRDRIRVRTGPSSETVTKRVVIEGSGSEPPILDVIAKTDGRGNILSQYFGDGNGAVELPFKFALPIFFFSSSGEVGLNIMESVPGVMELDSFNKNPDSYRPIYFKSSTITCYYFFIGKVIQFPINIHLDDDTQGYEMDLAPFIDNLIDGFCDAMASELDTSNGSDTIAELVKHLADMGKSLENMFLLGILPVSAAACVVLLQWPADVRSVTQCRDLWAERFDVVHESTQMQHENDGDTEWMDVSEEVLEELEAV